MSEIEPQIDELYRLPLGDFTSARNALAKTLKGADAARVKALVKPTAVPWAVNQLYWHRRAVYDRLLAAGRALREAQIAALGGQGRDVSRVNDTHRHVLAEAVREAVAQASDHGVKPAADQLARMLEMLSLRPDIPASDNTPGRHVDLVQASGLEALAGLTVAASAGDVDTPTLRPPRSDDTGARSAARPQAEVPDPGAEHRRAQEAAAARARAEENLQTAERGLERARSREEAAQRDVGLAQAALEQAQLALEAARRERRVAHEAWLAAKALT